MTGSERQSAEAERVVRIATDQITIPRELYEAMERPRALELGAPDEQGGRFLRRTRLRTRLAGRGVYRLAHVDAFANFVAVGVQQQPGHYRIVNYHPAYYLLPAVEHDEFWRRIVDYQEHRPPAAQEETAVRRSAWLAQDVLAALGDSFLELGCGAGRNLGALRAARPDAVLRGLEVNEAAASLARAHAEITLGSLYELSEWATTSVDVVFTSGVLMHVPHDEVERVVAAVQQAATRAVVHFELHGPSHRFDFHRYPRDYSAVYERLGTRADRYEIFSHRDYRSHGVAPFHHALLVWTKPN